MLGVDTGCLFLVYFHNTCKAQALFLVSFTSVSWFTGCFVIRHLVLHREFTILLGFL